MDPTCIGTPTATLISSGKTNRCSCFTKRWKLDQYSVTPSSAELMCLGYDVSFPQRQCGASPVFQPTIPQGEVATVTVPVRPPYGSRSQNHEVYTYDAQPFPRGRQTPPPHIVLHKTNTVISWHRLIFRSISYPVFTGLTFIQLICWRIQDRPLISRT